MFNLKKEKSKYPGYAEEAARLEQAGDFTDAAFAWAGAAHFARKPENREWAKARSDFCSVWGGDGRRSKEAA